MGPQGTAGLPAHRGRAAGRQEGAIMPSYQNVTPPLAVSPGDVGFSYNNEAFPGSAQSGTQFALSFPPAFPNSGQSGRCQPTFATAPPAVNLSLKAARPAVDARYRNSVSRT